MDTLFRLVSLHHHQQQQQHSATTTTSSSTSYHYYPEDEECCNNTGGYSFANIPEYMDEDDFSSSSQSSSKHHNHQQGLPYAAAAASYTPSSSATTATTPPHHSSSFDHPPADVDPGSARWSRELLLDCARAVSARDSPRVQHLLWTLNELSSPYGDVDQKIASYFLQALFARVTSTGDRCHRTLSSASDRSSSFESTRRVSLKFQEASPWSPFGHVASNSALLDALDGENRIHVLDLGTTFCTQWPTLLESLATRSSDDAPHLRLTTVLPSPSSSLQRVMKEVGARMERFARLMGVPFAFRYVHHDGDLSALDLHALCGAYPDEALAVNCLNSLHSVPSRRSRQSLLSAIRALNPRVVTVVEEEANMPAEPADEETFLQVFRESLRFFSAYLDSLEESFPRTSAERLALERSAGRAVVDLVACDPARSVERRETGRSWSGRMRAAGFEPVSLSDDGSDDVKALLRRYKDGWSLLQGTDIDDGSAAGIFLAWKDQPVVWASAWKPTS